MTLSATVKHPTAAKIKAEIERIEKQWDQANGDPVFRVIQAYNIYEDCKVATIICRPALPHGFAERAAS